MLTNNKNANRGFFPTIDGIIVDCKSLMSIKHSCISENCKISKCCCSSYDIFINNMELTNIIAYLPYASQYADILDEDNDFLNVFNDEGSKLYSIDKNDEGFCSFGYKNKSKNILCSLHKVAVNMKIPIRDIKPLECILWPLALTESNPIVLTVQNDVMRFPCNKKRALTFNELDNGIAEIIRNTFGINFLYKLNKKLVKL